MNHAFSKTAAVVVAALVFAAPGGAQSAGEERALQQFERGISGYVTLKDRLQQSLPPLAISPNAEQICAAVDALADAIRTARSTANAGDIFTPAAQPVFRARIEKALRDDHYPVRAFLADLAADVEPGARLPRLAVNGPYPCEFGAATPPGILLALPPLPKGLQYRFIGRDLLLDIDANLVIDILHDSLPHTSSASAR